MRERRFRYQWRRTFEGAADDFTCWANGYCIGRVRLHNAGSAQYWTWFMSIDEADLPIVSINGQCPDRDGACHALEAAYGRAAENEKKARQP